MFKEFVDQEYGKSKIQIQNECLCNKNLIYTKFVIYIYIYIYIYI